MNSNLLIVDDEPMIIESLKRLFRKQPLTLFCAGSAKEGLELFQMNDIGVVLSDLQMPEIDGLTFFEEIRKINTNAIQILMSGNATLEHAIAAINRLQLFGCIAKPWDDIELVQSIKNGFNIYNIKKEHQSLLELNEKQNIKLKELNSELENKVRLRTINLEEAIHEGIVMLANAAEVKDKCTGDHIHRILSITHDICLEMGFSPEKAHHFGLFSMVHDVGKLTVPDEILNKPGVLNEAEWEVIQSHTIAGENIMGDKPFYKIAREIARSHHENWDGTGYPDGLKGEHIPLSARIAAVADVFDALLHERPYKKAWSFENTIKEMKALSGIKFQPEILEAFLTLSTKKEYGNH